MTPLAAISTAPVHERAPVHAEVTQQGSEPVRTNEKIRAEESDATLLNGLSALADLLSNASETLNQCLLTLENKLSAASVAREEWIPIQTARSAVERAPAVDERQRSQERVFGGVAVTILRMSEPVIEPPSAPRCEWQYELGYSVAGDDWALMIRTASSDPSNEREGCVEFSDVIPLRDAPLEIRLKAIREIPSLLQVLDGPLHADSPPRDAVQMDLLEPMETTKQAETIVEQTAL